MAKGADQVIIIDDLTPSEDDADAHNKRRRLENVLRSYGDRVPRMRSISFASNQNVKEYSNITGCALLTCEELRCGKSSRARVIVLQFEENDVNDDALAYFQENLHILPDFVNIFVRYVGNNPEYIIDTIQRECKGAREYVKGKISTPRYRDAFGIMCATSRIFNDFLLQNGLMEFEEAQKMLVTDRELMLQIMMQNDSEVSMISLGITVIEALKDAIEKNTVQLETLEQCQKDNYKSKVLVDDIYMYVQLETLYECTKRYTDYRRIPFPYTNGKGIAELLNAENLLLVRKEGNGARKTHKLIINGKVENKRFAYLFRKKIEEIWQKEEEV